MAIAEAGPRFGAPLTPVTRALSRSLADTSHHRSSRLEAETAQIPKLIVQVVKIGLG